MPASISRSLFISLRWQIIVPVVGVLALTTVMFGRQDYLDRQRQIREEQHADQHKQVELLALLQQDRVAQVQILGDMLVNLPTVRQALQQQNRLALEEAFSPYWDELNLSAGLEAAVFTNASHDVLATWGTPTSAASHAKLAALTRHVEHQESPSKWLGCGQVCLIYVALPIIEQGHFQGTLTLAVGLQDVIYRFRQMTGSELAVLSPHQVEGKTRLAKFGQSLISVSGAEQIEGALKALRPAASDKEFFASFNNREYDVHRVSAMNDSEAEFLVLKDVTARNKAIAHTDHNAIANAILVLVGAILLIFVALRPTLERLRRGVAALALLGEGKYAEVRLARSQAKRSFHDEVGDVLEAASDAAGSLERLEVSKHVQTLRLQESEKTLKQERDFITTLLDTAPILVVTHEPGGGIRQINAQAIRVGGGDKAAIEAKGYPEVFFAPEERVTLQTLLDDLKVGHEASCEGRVVSGRRKTEVLWFHTRVNLSQADFVYLSVGLDVSERRAAERRVSHLMDHDVLTGLPNRKAFMRELDARLAQPEMTGVLLLCDLDQFKAINEIAGVAGGDALLLELVKKTAALSTMPVLSARVGGDEFALVFDAAAAKGVEAVKEINARLVGIGPRLGLPKQSFSVCAGIVMLDGSSDTSAADQIARAEAALDIARGKGQGQWHLFEQKAVSAIDQESRLYWSDEVDHALQEKRLQHFYQPIYDIKAGRVSHWECLIRMRDRNGVAVIPPGKFMPIAESTGQVRLTDRWGLEEACRRLRQLAMVPDAHLSVNLSGRSLDDESTLSALRNALRKHDIDGDRLILEITETHALADIQAAANLMKRFRDLGCKFSLDDFGVGYTSFRYLKELPVDYVKIDGAFITGLTRNREDQVFVKTLTDAVHGFGKRVVAEFVEDGETLELLTQFGVDYAQGYYIGKPQPEPSTAVPQQRTETL